MYKTIKLMISFNVSEIALYNSAIDYWLSVSLGKKVSSKPLKKTNLHKLKYKNVYGL